MGGCDHALRDDLANHTDRDDHVSLTNLIATATHVAEEPTTLIQRHFRCWLDQMAVMLGSF